MGDISISGIIKDSVYKDTDTKEYLKVIGVASSLSPKITSRFVVCQSLQYQAQLFVCDIDTFKYKVATAALSLVSAVTEKEDQTA